MQIRFFVFTLFILSFSSYASAQIISGKVIEKKSSTPVAYASVYARKVRDSTVFYNTITDSSGNFSITAQKGIYRVVVHKQGYTAAIVTAKAIADNIDLGILEIEDSAQTINEAIIRAKSPAVKQIGDTVEINAGSYKTQPDATAEDLIRKMPGITLQNGQIISNGETVKKVTVDGKDYFGDDAGAALKNLPAEIIDKIQIFDRASDQAQFTGFDDGNTSRSLNIVTKKGMSNGTFGRVYAGYGTDNHYQSGLVFNRFKGESRFSVLGLSNNINIQNFSSQDLLSLGSTGGGGGRGSGRPRMDGGASENFIVNQSNGISQTNAGGLNYSDKWGKRIKIAGSYFFNQTENDQNTSLNRSYFNSNNLEANQTYFENSSTINKSMNHRFNLRLELALDSNTSVIYTPKFSWQSTNIHQLYDAFNRNSNDSLNGTNTAFENSGDGFNWSNNMLWRQKLNTKGRTFSIQLGNEWNTKKNETVNKTGYAIYYPTDSLYYVNQKGLSNSPTQKYSSRINYSEPAGKNGIIQLEYVGNWNLYNTDKETYNNNALSPEFEKIDTLLSNRYENTYQSHLGSVSYRIRKDKFWFGTGIGYQAASLHGDQEFPLIGTVNRSFKNILPNMMMNYKFNKNANLRVYYRTNTNAPSISQLQNVIDVSNPLILTTGTPNLKQEYQQNLVLRYSKVNPEKSRNFFMGLFGTHTNNYITNSTIFLEKDTQISESFKALKGTQLIKPVNLNGYMSAKAFSTYGFPVKKLKSTINITAGYTYTRTPGTVNGAVNIANTGNTNTGLVIASNISENIDFTFSWTSNFNSSKNSLQTQLNNNYVYNTGSAKINYIIKRKLVMYTEATYNSFSGLGAEYNQQYLLWNASVAYKFLKGNAGEFRLTCFDILNQNNSINRSITETYFEDKRTTVLSRYFMATFAYNFKKFGK